MRLIDADYAIEQMQSILYVEDYRAAVPLPIIKALVCAALKSEGVTPTIKNRWISVEDRLPEGRGEIYAEGLEDSATVLVACITQDGKRKHGLACYIRDHELREDDGWNGVTDEEEEIDDRHAKVTHWMPLPELPEEGEAGE